MKINNVWIMKNNKKCGKIQDGVYITQRKTKEHFYIKGRGYPISEQILQFLLKNGINEIIIEEIGENIRKFTTLTKNYLDYPIFFHKGYDEQRCLPLDEMLEIQKVSDEV